MNITEEQMKSIYLYMRRIRMFETAAKRLYTENRMAGFGHLYAGEEAVAVGVCATLRTDDYISSTHRGHGHLIAKGGDIKLMMAELFARQTGYCKGKGGSLHIADFDVGILGANGIVGGGIPISVGAGLSIQMHGTNQVSVCFFGDGASDQGTFHESLNLASTWKLPVVFICENNLYAISISQKRHQAISDISVRAQGYNMPGISVDGNDVMAVYKVAQTAVERARSGSGPTLIECKTYRHGGHFAGDPANYRPQEEVEEWLKKDPLLRYVEYLVENEILTKEEIGEIDAQIDKEIEEAIDFADAQPYAPLESTVEDVYSDIVEEVRKR